MHFLPKFAVLRAPSVFASLLSTNEKSKTCLAKFSTYCRCPYSYSSVTRKKNLQYILQSKPLGCTIPLALMTFKT